MVGSADHIVSLDVQATAEQLLNECHFVSMLPEKSLMYYDQGAYVDNGWEYAERILVQTFGRLKTVYRKDVLTKQKIQEVLYRLQILAYRDYWTSLSPIRVPFFDSDLSIINMENGLYNWQTGEFKEHTSSYPSRIQIAAKYDSEADCTMLDEIVRDVLKARDIQKYYEFLAYNLYRAYVIQKGFIFFGPAGSGKSQLLDMLKAMIGEHNCEGVTLQDLGGRSAYRFAPARLLGKLSNISGDLDKCPIEAVGVYKMLTSGVDLISGDIKYVQSPIKFVNFAKFAFSANELPPINDNSMGFYRRVESFICDRYFEATGDKYDRLSAIKDPQEISGLFNKVIELLPDLLERRAFSNANSIADVKRFYQMASDPLVSFIDDCVEERVGEMISRAEMFEEYKAYCKSKNFAHIDSQNVFTREFRKRMGFTRYNEGNMPYKGKVSACWRNVGVDRK